MLKFNIVSKFFKSPSENTDSLNKVANHWDSVQVERKELQNKWYDWGDHPKVAELVYNELFGSKDISIFDYIRKEHPGFSKFNALSLCCGPGTFEKMLVENGVFAEVTGIDIAPGLIVDANASKSDLEDKLSFIEGDVNAGNFGHNTYDIVIAKAALHHIENLEQLMEGVKRCLKPGGHLVTIDFFGPTRFQWTETQLAEAIKFTRENVPPELRLKSDGKEYKVTRPTIEQVIEVDPSEAIRSGEIERFIHDYFKEIQTFKLGGTLLNLILDTSIINNFDESNDVHNQVIEDAFRLERKLIDVGILGSDFKFIIAEIDK